MMSSELESQLAESRRLIEQLQEELHRSNSELLQLTLELEDRVSERTAALRREIIQRQQAEEHLHLQVAALEATANPMVITDRDGIIQWANPAFSLLTGYRLEEAVGRTPGELVRSGKQDQSFYEEMWQTILSGQVWRGELVNRRRDGTLYHESLTITPVPGQGRAVTHFIAVKQDITQQQRQQREERAIQGVREEIWKMQRDEDIGAVLIKIRDSLSRLEVACDACGINLVEEAAGGPVVRRHEMTPQDEWRRIDDDPDGNEKVARFWRGGQVVHRADLDESDPSQERQFLLWGYGSVRRSVVDVPFSHGTLAVNSERAHAYSAEDIAFLQRLGQVLSEGFHRLDDLKALTESEDRFRQAQKLESLGRLAGGVAHDFNNLLTIITGNTQLLLRHADPSTALHAGLKEIQDAGERAVALVRQLLVFSRRQVLHRQVLDLNQLIGGVSKMLRRVIGEDIELVTTLASEPGYIEADPGQMEQVLMNLAVNARDAMPRGGRLIIETRSVELSQRFLSDHAMPGDPGPYLLLTVTDTGTGMSPEVQTQIFEPFFTTKEAGKGTGLGLATVYGVIRQSGGHISVSSTPGQGATFAIYLPRVAAAAARTTAPALETVALPGRGDEVLLVVEDDEGVRRLAVRSLEAQGYTVLEAGNGTAALEVLAGQAPVLRLLLTDVVMPGMLGRELADRARRLIPELKVLYMSGYSELPALPPEVQTSPGCFLQKPFDPDILVRRVRQILG